MQEIIHSMWSSLGITPRQNVSYPEEGGRRFLP